MNFEIVGINFQTAPLQVRERLAVNADHLADTLQEIRCAAGVSEVIIVSTCNRTEVICAGGAPKAVYHWVQNQLSASDAQATVPYLYHHTDLAAAKHLFRVIAGLDSMVLGEPQIHGQVKSAYQAARTAGTLGATLDKVFQRSFYVAKKVRTQTAIGELPVSVAYAAILLAKRLFADLTEHKVLLIGAGETSALVWRHLIEHGVREFIVANRDVARAESLAAELGGEACGLSDLPAVLPQADLVFSSTGADHSLLHKMDFKQALKQRRRRPMFVVDLAVPRDIDADVNELDDVYLYTVDDLSSVIAEGQQSRQDAAKQAEALIEHEVQAFGEWLASLTADDLIRQLRDHADQLRDTALARASKKLATGADPNEVLQQLATQLSNKWLHDPLMALRIHNNDENLAAAAKQLFNIDETTSEDVEQNATATVVDMPRRFNRS